MRIQSIINTTAHYYGLCAEDLRRGRRGRSRQLARQMIAVLATHHTPLTYADIAEQLECDYSTVRNGIRRHRENHQDIYCRDFAAIERELLEGADEE